ncbi:MAG: polysaccharide biosynthesis/export family protein [Parvibaculaceae bacterium]
MRFPILIVLPLLLSACAETWEANPPRAASGGMGVMADGTVAQGPGAVSSVSELPTRTSDGIQPPYGAEGSAAAYEYDKGYRIGAGDRVTVRVAGEADLTNDYLVDGSGNISMPYIKTTYVGGMSAQEAERTIANRLRKGFLRNPNVSVQVTTLRPFFILGEVNTAGSFAYQPGMTVQNAVAIAGGYSARAHQGPVLVTRKNVDGTKTYKAPVTTQIYPGDVIYVRERWF